VGGVLTSPLATPSRTFVRGSIHWPIDFSAVLATVNAVGSAKKSTIAAAGTAG
jgi:hypothetical protein